MYIIYDGDENGGDENDDADEISIPGEESSDAAIGEPDIEGQIL